jgi:hypothetical protein
MVETKKAPPISLKIKPKGSSSPPLSKPKETKPLSPSTKQPPKKIQMPSQDKIDPVMAAQKEATDELRRNANTQQANKPKIGSELRGKPENSKPDPAKDNAERKAQEALKDKKEDLTKAERKAQRAEKWAKRRDTAKGAIATYLLGKLMGGGGRKSPDEIRKGSIWWVVFALILYITDVFTGFNGFDFTTLINAFSSPDKIIPILTTIILNVGFVATIILYKFFLSPNIEEWISFIFLAAFTWFIMSQAWSLGVAIHLLFIIIISIGLIYRCYYENYIRANILIASMVFIDFFLFSILTQFNIPFFEIMPLNRFILPVWFFLALSLSRPSKPKHILTFVIIMFYVFNALNVVTQYDRLGLETLQQKDFRETKEFAVRSWDNLKKVGYDLYFKSRQSVFGDLDPNAAKDPTTSKRTGIYFVEKLDDTRSFYKGEPIVISTKIKGETLKKPIKVLFNCRESSTDGITTPPSTTVSNTHKNVDCKLEGLSGGSKEVTFEANAILETSSHRPGYFVDSKEKVFERTEPIENYITKKVGKYQDTAITLDSPLKIQIEIGDQINEIDKELKDQEIRFAVHFINNLMWDGSVGVIKEIVLQLPKAFGLREDGTDPNIYCNGFNFEVITCSEFEDDESCDDSRYNLYKYSVHTQETDNKRKLDLRKSTQNLICAITLSNPEDIFLSENARFSGTELFRVASKYNYKLEQEIGFEIQEGTGIAKNIQDCSTMCQYKDGCICPKDCKKRGKIAEGYTCGVIGLLEKNNLDIPASTNLMNSCNNNEITFKCEGQEKCTALSIFDNGVVTKSESGELHIDYGSIYTVVYTNLEEININQKDIPNKGDVVGSFSDYITFRIEKDNNNIHLLDFYKASDFIVGKNCITPLGKDDFCEAICENYQCSCDENCAQLSTSKGKTCGGMDLTGII